MQAPRLSVCLIARNEAVNIERCLASISGCADEIVLVDTGSSDATPDIAQTMGARVIHSRWTGDFSAARNLSLEAATGDWILFLDCDEELSPDSRDELKKVLEDEEHEGFFVLVDNLTDKGRELSVPSVRLFRNRSCFRFQGKLHEQIVTSILSNYDRSALAQSDITITHYGYHPQTANLRAKMKRNLDILLTYGEWEKDGFYYYNLGTEYWRLGQREQVLENYSLALAKTDLANQSQNFGPILVRRTISVLIELNRFRTAIEQLKGYQAVLKDYNDLVFLEGACHLACGRYSRAASLFRRYLKMPPLPRKYPREQGFHGFSGETMLSWARDQAHKGQAPNLAVVIAGTGSQTHLARCIRSAQEIARELIYLDTGVPPGGGELAYQMGAAVVSLEPGADVREKAVSQAQAKWILVLNADETLAAAGREAVSRIVNNPDREGYLLKIRTLMGSQKADCHLQGRLRLFRRRAPQTGNQPRTGWADITVECHRYASGATVDPPATSAYDRGLTGYYRRDFAAAAALLETTARKDDPDFIFFYGSSLLESGRISEALDVLERGAARYGDYTDLRYLLGLARSRTGDPQGAEREFAACLQLGDAPWNKYTVSPGTGTHRALCSLANIQAARGDAPGAMDLFLRAVKEPGGSGPALVGLALLVDQWPEAPLVFLKDRGLLNSVSLGILAGALAGKARYRESMAYLSQAAEQLAREPAPRKLAAWQEALNTLLDSLTREVS